MIYEHNDTAQDGHEGLDHEVPCEGHEEVEEDHLDPIGGVDVFLFDDYSSHNDAHQ